MLTEIKDKAVRMLVGVVIHIKNDKKLKAADRLIERSAKMRLFFFLTEMLLFDINFGGGSSFPLT